jgi:hypothetical protein
MMRIKPVAEASQDTAREVMWRTCDLDVVRRQTTP